VKALLLGVLLVVGCDGSPSCEKTIDHVLSVMSGPNGEKPPADYLAKAREEGLAKCRDEKWSPAIRTCMMKVTRSEQALGCNPAGIKMLEKKPGSEARRNLAQIAAGAKAYYAESGRLPEGKIGPVPAIGSCCPRGKCAPDPSLWTDPMWNSLRFSVDDAQAYSYSYEGSSTAFTARAIGDVDCDTEQSTFEITGKVENGAVSTGEVRAENERE
jgi:hypothetical protein